MAAQDVRSLTPRVRRAVEGPFALPANRTLTETQIEAMAADAIADIILFTEGRWPHTLTALERDATTQAPVHWAVTPELSLDEEAVVAAQSAIQYFFYAFRDMKVSETIRNEGREWSYSLSASVLTEQIKALRDQRDRALAAIEGQHPVMARYASFLTTRDALGAAMLEPWLLDSGGRGGLLLLPNGFQG